MPRDLLSIEAKAQQFIEILVEGDSQVWVPVVGTKLYLVDRNDDLRKVKAVRVRKL